MKKLILLTFFISSAYAGINKGDVPTECQVVFNSPATESGSPSKVQTALALRTAVERTKKIMDLKFQTYSYIQDNKAIYGEYVRQMEMKRILDADRTKTELKKQQMLDESTSELETIAKFQTDAAQSIHKDLTIERNNERIRYNNILYAFDKDWKRMKRSYSRAVEAWAPYGDQLKNLEKVEDALQKSLSNLQDLHQLSATAFADILSALEAWRPEDSEDSCELINKKLAELSQKLK